MFGLDAETDVPVGGGTRLWGDGFEVETLINIRVAQAGLKVTEVASYEHSRIHGVSNLNAARDGWRVLRTILAERYYHHNRQKAQRKLAADALLHDHEREVMREFQPHALISGLPNAPFRRATSMAGAQSRRSTRLDYG